MTTIVGITGGIGSGKSVVSRILAAMGYPVYDADQRARALMDRSPRIRTQLQTLFGPQAYDGQTLNRPYLAARIFSDETARSRVNAIVHPEVRADFKRWAQNSSSPVVFMESAILYESGFDDTVDQVWVVAAPETLRRQRVAARDGWTPDQIHQRMASQMDETQKCRRADVVIHNDDRRALLPQITAALDALR